MELFRKPISFSEMTSFVKCLFGSGLKQFWEDYNSFVEERAVLEDTLTSERCARKDTEARCKSLYDSLEKAKHANEKLRAKVCLLEISLAAAEKKAVSLENAIAKTEASLRRLSKMCFGKKGEKLKQLLGKTDFAHLQALFAIEHAGDNLASADGESGTIEEAMPGNAIRPSTDQNSCAHDEGMDQPTQPQSDTAEKDKPECAGERNEEKEGGQDGKTTPIKTGEDGSKGKRGRKDIKRKAGYLDNYCDPGEGVVYTFDNINYNLEDILHFFSDAQDGAPIYMSSNIEVYKTLEYFPGFYYTKYHISPTLRQGDTCLRGLRTDRILNASAASPSVLAHLGMMKYRQGLPITTLCGLAKDEGGYFGRGTAAGWLNTGYDNLLMPVHMAMLQFARKYGLLIGDETYAYRRINGKVETSYFWGFRTSPLSDKGHQIVFYAFDDTRQSAVPLFYLHGFTGKFLSDGYIAYEVFEAKDGSIVRCCCWVHGRRALVEALPGGGLLENLTEESKSKLWAWTALCILSEMFRLEKEWGSLSPQLRLERRREELAPLIDRFFEEAHKAAGSETFDRSSEEGKAVMYFCGREAALRRLLEDGEVPMSTNDIERCNIVIALTRKRAKVFDSLKGARAAGGYFSLICTAEANGINPEKYLEYLYTVMPSVVYEHRQELDQYREYLEEAERRFEAVKKQRRKNPNAPNEIDWEGLEEPDLGFLLPLMPWSEETSAFMELNSGPDKKSILDAMTRKNLEESTLSLEAMNRILHTEKNLADARLDGLREILLSMNVRPGKNVFTDSSNPGADPVKGMVIYNTYFPERLFEMQYMRKKMAGVPPQPEELTGKSSTMPPGVLQMPQGGDTVGNMGAREHKPRSIPGSSPSVMPGYPPNARAAVCLAAPAKIS